MINEEDGVVRQSQRRTSTQSQRRTSTTRLVEAMKIRRKWDEEHAGENSDAPSDASPTAALGAAGAAPVRSRRSQQKQKQRLSQRKPKLRRGRSGTLKMDDKDAQEMRDASAQHQRANL